MSKKCKHKKVIYDLQDNESWVKVIESTIVKTSNGYMCQKCQKKGLKKNDSETS